MLLRVRTRLISLTISSGDFELVLFMPNVKRSERGWLYRMHKRGKLERHQDDKRQHLAERHGVTTRLHRTCNGVLNTDRAVRRAAGRSDTSPPERVSDATRGQVERVSASRWVYAGRAGGYGIASRSKQEKFSPHPPLRLTRVAISPGRRFHCQALRQRQACPLPECQPLL